MGTHSGPKILADNFTARIFTSSGVFTPAFTGTIEVLVVAGGGGAGSDMGGGGGGGGVISNTAVSVTAGTPITVTVGAGGSGAPAGTGGHATTKGTNGANSVFGSLTAVGGGAGGTSYYSFGNSFGNSGGSGGGGSGYNNSQTPALTTGTGFGAAGEGTAGQGNRGGFGRDSYYSGGGGGAGGAGTDANATPNGGPGILNSILDLPLYWGGGGGGASYSLSTGGNGGIGGGGGGAVGATTGGVGYNNGSPGGGGSPNSQTNTPGGNGGQFTGGGGGGGAHYNFTNKGGDGGSGIVIVRYISSLGNSTGGSPIGQSPLKFMFDMGNTLKSWKGATATNLSPNLGLVQIQGSPTLAYLGVEDGWKKYSLNGTWSAGTYPYSIGIDGVTFTGGVTYSSGVLIKTNVPQKFANLFGGMNYVNEPMNNAGTSFSIAQPDGSLFVGRTGFQYTSTTAQTGYILSQPVVGQSFSSATDFVYIKDGQVETGSFTTPFVAGTRSNTQALLDLTRNNTITVNSLTYNSNNTFSFNNIANSTFSIPDSTLIRPPSVTISAWVNLTAFNPLNDFDGQFPTIAWKGYDGQAGTQASYALTLITGAFPRLTIAPTPLVSTVALPTNTWVNIVGTYAAGGAMVLYRNGEVDITGTGPASISYAAQVFGIGTRTFNGANQFPWNGSISEVQLFNRALTAREVQQNFAAKRGRYGI
jgi:hypothetical protein